MPGKSIKKINLRSPGLRFFSPPAFLETTFFRKVFFFWPNPNIAAISRLATRKNNFSFNQVTHKKIETLLRNLNTKKAFQDTHILIRIIKENSDLLANFILKDNNHRSFHKL